MADGRNGGMDRVNSKDLRLCANCFAGDAKGVDVGPDVGSQRDPYRESVQLCDPCAAYLVGGDFDQLRERFNAERTVRR